VIHAVMKWSGAIVLRFVGSETRQAQTDKENAR
jgi:hypothetical protein